MAGQILNGTFWATWQLASPKGQLKVLSFLRGEGESPGGTAGRLFPGASSRGARCKPGLSGWALDAPGTQTPPCSAVTRRREGLLRLQPWFCGGSAVRGGTHSPSGRRRWALGPGTATPQSAADGAVCAGHAPSGTAPRPLWGRSVQQPPGKPGPSTGHMREQHGGVRVCIYLQHGARVGACGCVWARVWVHVGPCGCVWVCVWACMRVCVGARVGACGCVCGRVCVRGHVWVCAWACLGACGRVS